jgi:hypothetical protein
MVKPFYFLVFVNIILKIKILKKKLKNQQTVVLMKSDL